MPKVSVVIPVYNVMQYLRECLDSVIAQTIKDIEIICVDDGSTDDSSVILQEYKAKDSRIHIFSQDNKGAGAARNKAINTATGEYVVFMDSDDWYPETDILETLYNKAVQNRVDICGGSFSELRNGKLITTFHGLNEKYAFHKEGIISFREYQFDYGYHRFLYKRDLLIKNHIYFPDYRRFQDPPFFVKAMICSDVFYATPKITYCYRAGHNVIQWDSLKTNDLVRGLIDILDLTREHRLPILHQITVDRFNNKYYEKRFIENIRLDNLELLALFLKANALVDVELLREVNPQLAHEGCFILDPIKNFFSLRNSDKSTSDACLRLERHKTQLEAQLEAIRHSWSYIIGRMITFIPRGVIRFIRHCYFIKKSPLQ